VTAHGYSLSLADIAKRFPDAAGGEVHALRGVDLQIRPGEFIVAVGHNGSGKSTLLNIINGTLEPSAGSLRLIDGNQGRDWTRTPSAERAALVATVVQDPNQNIVPDLTVAEHLALATRTGVRLSPLRRAVPRRARDAQREALGKLGIAEKADALAGELSFGQRQLLALQVALLRRPAFLLLDEPTASLDRANEARCLGFVQHIWESTGATVLLVTHDLAAALRFGTRLLVLDDGYVRADLDAGARAGLGIDALAEMCGYAA
jgi:putative tryptophan/tyrosine transport system ATP-binding protein